jgi:uncharacterized protein YpuA (DUF1002 family)
MALLIVVLVLLTSAISGVVGAYVCMKYFHTALGTDDLQMQIDYLKDSLNKKHEISMKYVKNIDQREIDHWNFINLNCKLW